MSDTSIFSKEPAPPDENATLADLKAKKDRQRAMPMKPSPAAPAQSATVESTPHIRPTRNAPRPDRAGKVMIAGYFPTATSKALKHIAVDEGLSLQEVMADAFTLYLRAKRDTK